MPIAGQEATFDSNQKFEHDVNEVPKPELPYPITSQPKKSCDNTKNQSEHTQFVYPPIVNNHSGFMRPVIPTETRETTSCTSQDFIYPPIAMQHQAYIFKIPK